MSKIAPKPKLFPPWNMPSDPVKAVWWFMHWSLQVAVRYFWLPIALMIVYEGVANTLTDGIGNGLIVGIVTLGIGLVVWAVLYGALRIVNVWMKITQTISDAQAMRQGMFQGPFGQPFGDISSFDNHERDSNINGKVVEGSISEVDKDKEH